MINIVLTLGDRTEVSCLLEKERLVCDLASAGVYEG